MLKNLRLKPVYDSSDYDLVRELIVPLLSESKEYWRGVGYFTSGWIKTACDGIVNLIHNGGIARIVTSPIMQKADWEALQRGDLAKRDQLLQNLLRSNVRELSQALSKDTLNALAWMVADGVLEFRFAIPREFRPMGMYHDKVGIFIDGNNDIVAIHGSLNDSAQGSLNGEAFSVFKSWDDGQSPYVEQHHRRLRQLWENENTHFRVLPIPKAIRHQIMELRTAARPWSKQVNSISSNDELLNQASGAAIKLRPYQRDAIDSWVNNGYRGIFEMATGAGRTFTALAAAGERVKKLNKLVIIILVPYLHLLEQWRKDCELFEFTPILCSGDYSHKEWATKVRSTIRDQRLGLQQKVCILVTHATSASPKFLKATRRLPPESTILIADEVHGLGARNLRNALIPEVSMRLGLSATPRRWYDEEGTQVLLDYFNGVCFEYTLSEAIYASFLTEYNYVPLLVNLSAGEWEEYEKLSRMIIILASKKQTGDAGAGDSLKKKLLRRSRLVSAAENKLPLLLAEIRKQLLICDEAGTELSNVLIYCAPGTHKDVLKAVSGLGIRCHEFVADVSMKNREKILEQFSQGEIQALVAIKCLDEGVDIPSTQNAYFLASTINPREFIQRRGRILRKYPGKKHANVYDFIVVPDIKDAVERRSADLSLLRREMPRLQSLRMARKLNLKQEIQSEASLMPTKY